MNEERSQIIINDQPRSQAAEAYRSLRTNLQLLSPDKAIKSIIIVSSCPQEGKTTLCINLGAAIAQIGKKVVIVDMDLHRPSIHHQFDMVNGSGIVDVLTGSLDIDKVIQTTHIPRLDIIMSGSRSPDPSGLINSNKMKVLMDDLAKRYDIVIYDTPPIASVSDAILISSRVDGAVIVINPNISTRQEAKNTKEQLEMAKVKIFGAVLNKVAQPVGGYYYYYHEE